MSNYKKIHNENNGLTQQTNDKDGGLGSKLKSKSPLRIIGLSLITFFMVLVIIAHLCPQSNSSISVEGATISEDDFNVNRDDSKTVEPKQHPPYKSYIVMINDETLTDTEVKSKLANIKDELQKRYSGVILGLDFNIIPGFAYEIPVNTFDQENGFYATAEQSKMWLSSMNGVLCEDNQEVHIMDDNENVSSI